MYPVGQGAAEGGLVTTGVVKPCRGIWQMKWCFSEQFKFCQSPLGWVCVKLTHVAISLPGNRESQSRYLQLVIKKWILFLPIFTQSLAFLKSYICNGSCLTLYYAVSSFLQCLLLVSMLSMQFQMDFIKSINGSPIVISFSVCLSVCPSKTVFAW